MEYPEMVKVIKNLEFDKKTIIVEYEGIELYVLRPSELPKNLKNEYDVKKNFQIWLKENKREFKPNHLRIMIDLNLRVRSRPELKIKLLEAFDNIFYGKDPNEAISELKNEEFEHFLNPLPIIANLAQLMIFEQEYNYKKESKFEPKTLFLQGWIREFIDSPKEIDNMCMSVGRFQPPVSKYTNKENKKNKKLEENLKKLWYIN